jgi:hypothetical protein
MTKIKKMNEQNNADGQAQKINLRVFDELHLQITINSQRDGYTFKTPKGWGGRHYYSLCNAIDDALEEQYNDIYWTIHNTIRNS